MSDCPYNDPAFDVYRRPVVRSTIRPRHKPPIPAYEVDYEEVVPYPDSGGEIRQYQLIDGRLKLVNRQKIIEPVNTRRHPARRQPKP